MKDNVEGINKKMVHALDDILKRNKIYKMAQHHIMLSQPMTDIQ
jgi:hypothetical protein